MKTLTKNQINKETRVIRGNGFDPQYVYIFNHKNLRFETSFTNFGLLVTKIDDETGEPISNIISMPENKKEFVNAIYNYFT